VDQEVGEVHALQRALERAVFIRHVALDELAPVLGQLARGVAVFRADETADVVPDLDQLGR
jgi:hypothetical protein